MKTEGSRWRKGTVRRVTLYIIRLATLLMYRCRQTKLQNHVSHCFAVLLNACTWLLAATSGTRSIRDRRKRIRHPTMKTTVRKGLGGLYLYSTVVQVHEQIHTLQITRVQYSTVVGITCGKLQRNEGNVARASGLQRC